MKYKENDYKVNYYEELVIKELFKPAHNRPHNDSTPSAT